MQVGIKVKRAPELPRMGVLEELFCGKWLPCTLALPMGPVDWRGDGDLGVSREEYFYETARGCLERFAETNPEVDYRIVRVLSQRTEATGNGQQATGKVMHSAQCTVHKGKGGRVS